MEDLFTCKSCDRKYNLNSREPIILNCCYETACKDCVNKLKEIFNIFQSTGNRKSFIVLQFLEDFELYDNIGHSLQIPIEFLALSIYIPKLFIKKGKGARVEYLQVYFSHFKAFTIIKKDIRGQFQLESCDIFYNMLQTEKVQEAGFFPILV